MITPEIEGVLPKILAKLQVTLGLREAFSTFLGVPGNTGVERSFPIFLGVPQWTVITKIIDECDFYLLAIGGRYGSIDESVGISYTEKEYARELGRNGRL